MTSEPKRRADLLPLVIADIYELAGALRARGDRVAQTVGQSQARWQVLSAASGAPMTVPQIARRLGISRQAVQRLGDLLVADGLATYADNRDHKGSPHLILTEAGRGAFDRLMKTARRGHEELADRLKRIDLTRFREDARILLDALTKGD